MNQDVEARLRNLGRAARCGAKTRVGTPCQCPAMRGCKRCRLHGGTAPRAFAKGSHGDRSFRSARPDLPQPWPICFAASFAVLPFEPHTTMPPSTARNRCRHRAGIEPDCAEEHRGEHNAADAHGNSRGQDVGSKLFDVLLQPHNLVVQVAVAFVDMQSSNTPDGSPIGVP